MGITEFSTFGTLSLVDRISVVTLSLALNLVPLERLFSSLSSDVSFGRIVHLWGKEYN